MKLIVFLMALLAAMLAFLYASKKLGFDLMPLLTAAVNKLNQPVQQPIAVQQDMAQVIKTYNVDYESFGFLVWNCLQSIHTLCDLDCPGSASGIYTARMLDRMKYIGGQMVFLYEIPLSCGAIRNGVFTEKKVDIERIRGAFAENLPDYMASGYYYNGSVYVWPIEKSRVRLEVHGVNRKIEIGGNIII